MNAQNIFNFFESYYGNISRIDEHMRHQKLSVISENKTNSLFNIEDDLFSDYTLNPKDMEFEVVQMNSQEWDNYVMHISSAINDSGHGRSIKLAVKEKKTQKYVGFIRLGSSLINCKPRNNLIDGVFTDSKEKNKRFNDSTIMGFVIVPVQPFGYNYLGGKLLAAICASHEIREMFNKKYNCNLCLFETTSLYGNSKNTSQYDGMKPFIRFKGLTDSKFIPMLYGKSYDQLKEIVNQVNSDLIVTKGTSKKMKTMVNIISYVRKNIEKEYLDRFNQIIENAKNLTEQKRYYVSTYGYDNVFDYLSMKDNELKKGQNFEKHYMDNIITWWKTKAEKRFETLTSNGNIRKNLEIWNENSDFDIIR